LSITELGKRLDELKDFMNPIQVANLAPAAKSSVSTKGDTRTGKRIRKRREFKPLPRRKARVRTVAKARIKPKMPLSKPEVKLPQERPRLVPRKQIETAKLDTLRPKIEDKRITYATKRTAYVKRKTVTRRYTVRKQVTKKELMAQLKPKVEVYKEVRTSVEQVTRIRKVVPRRIAKIDIKRIEEMPLKEVERTSRKSREFVPAKHVAEKKMEFVQEKEKVDLQHKRIVYDTQKIPEQRPLDQPKLIVQDQPVIEMVKNVTTIQRRIKKTVVVSTVQQVPVISDMALEQIHPSRELEKEVQVAKLTAPAIERVVEKRLKLEERTSTAVPVRVSKVRVTYKDKMAEVEMKVLDVPVVETEAVQSAPVEAVAAEVASVSKLEVAAIDPLAEASVLPTPDRLVEDTAPAQVYEKADEAAVVDAPVSRTVEKVIDMKKRSAKAAAKTTVVAFKTTRKSSLDSIQPSQTTSLLSEQAGGTSDSDIPLEVNLPEGNVTNQQLYKLTGSIDPEIKMAFITVNDVTQLVTVVDGTFEAEIALVKGINKVTVLAFNSKGGIARKAYQIYFTPPAGGVPVIKLESPENGRQGAKEGDPIVVSGTISDPTITEATLLLNRVPIKLKVENGRFRRKIFLPAGRINTFRVMAKNKNGVVGYSALHTVLSGYDIDVLNPRPF